MKYSLKPAQYPFQYNYEGHSQSLGTPGKATPAPQMSTQENWDRLAKFDAMWTILSDSTKFGGKWDPDEFFATGSEVLERLATIESHGAALADGVAVDFGCGVGRVSRWLAKRFSRVVGVDISAQMLVIGERYNDRAAPITFVLGNERNIPLATSSADFVHSIIVLQHIPKPLQEMYLREFSRIVRPGGYLYFQTPSHAVDVSDTSFSYPVMTNAGPASVESHTYPRAELEAHLERCGCRMIHVSDDASCGTGMKSYFYLAQRQR